MQKAITGLTLTCRIFHKPGQPLSQKSDAPTISLPVVQSSSLDEATKAHYEGLARMNRAWEYYQLVRMYGDVQWIDKLSTQPTTKPLRTTHRPG